MGWCYIMLLFHHVAGCMLLLGLAAYEAVKAE